MKKLAPVVGRIGMAPPAKRSLFWYPWYPGDFLRKTRGFSVTAKGVYRELLDVQWDEGSLPEDPDELRRLIAATPAEWKAGWPPVGKKFPVGLDGHRRNPRLDQERNRSLRRSEAASQSATSRWSKSGGR